MTREYVTPQELFDKWKSKAASSPRTSPDSSSDNAMWDFWLEVSRELRNRGYAVSCFTPMELRTASLEDIEDAMVAGGNNAIDSLSPWKGNEEEV